MTHSALLVAIWIREVAKSMAGLTLGCSETLRTSASSVACGTATHHVSPGSTARMTYPIFAMRAETYHNKSVPAEAWGSRRPSAVPGTVARATDINPPKPLARAALHELCAYPADEYLRAAVHAIRLGGILRNL